MSHPKVVHENLSVIVGPILTKNNPHRLLREIQTNVQFLEETDHSDPYVIRLLCSRRSRSYRGDVCFCGKVVGDLKVGQKI